MSGYEVVIEALREASSAAHSAAEQAAGVDVAGALAGVAPALPGSRSVGAADAVRQAWEGRGRSWSGELRGYGDGLSAAANRYASNEQAAEADLSVPTPQSGGGGPKAI